MNEQTNDVDNLVLLGFMILIYSITHTYWIWSPAWPKEQK